MKMLYSIVWSSCSSSNRQTFLSPSFIHHSKGNKQLLVEVNKEYEDHLKIRSWTLLPLDSYLFRFIRLRYPVFKKHVGLHMLFWSLGILSTSDINVSELWQLPPVRVTIIGLTKCLFSYFPVAVSNFLRFSLAGKDEKVTGVSDLVH